MNNRTIKQAYTFNCKAYMVLFQASLRVYNRYAKDSLAGRLYKQANNHRRYMRMSDELKL